MASQVIAARFIASPLPESAARLRYAAPQPMMDIRCRAHGYLRWLECHERGNWASSDAIVEAYGLDQADVVGCFAEAVEWAEAALRTVA
jgi:hypothetical protein